MQKLVKKTLHYETIMPVEAYEGEDTWEDEINAIFLGIGAASLFLPPPFNGIGVLFLFWEGQGIWPRIMNLLLNL